MRSRIVRDVVLATCLVAAVAAPVFAQDAADLERYRTAERLAKAHLATFEALDFDVVRNQAWDRLKESHSANVVVHWPDGHVTQGLAKHAEDLKGMFVYAPDTRVTSHPVRVANGEWTAVTGIMEGTFTRPMPAPTGAIQPTGKAFSLSMVTIGHWKNGVMDEEYLFWDNATFMAQIGLAK